MKALSLTQPWASLVACSAKTIETRSWSTSFRGPLAIHAAKGFPREARDIAIMTQPFVAALSAGGFPFACDLPLGQVIATATLTDVVRITSGNIPPEPEASFGDYSTGRYAWHFTDIQRLATPIPAKGALGLWQWDVPVELKHLEVA